MTPWLFVGSTGRLGRMARRAWTAQPPARPVVWQSRRATADADLVWSPMEGAAALRRWCEAHGTPGVMIMLGGVTPGPGAGVYQNGTLAEACLAAAAEVGIRRVLVASSSAVYGAGEGAPLSEEAPLRPVTDYGRAKVAMEQACRAWVDRGVEVCALRIGNVVGADALMRNAVRATPDQPLLLDRFADGRGPVRSYIGPETLARALGSLCVAPSLPEAVNVAAPAPVSMERLLEVVAVPWRFREAPATALQRITLNCERLAAIHPFAADDARAERMVAEWDRAGDPR